LLDASRPEATPASPGRTRAAAILVGSAKVKGTSASEVMARALLARLAGEGVATELHFATDFVHDKQAAEVAGQIARADLFVLVTPLYVDALPALVVHALDHVARARTGAPARFVAVVNCGFPEPEQVRTAMRIAGHFCARAGYRWAGGLPLGGGGYLKPTVPLDEQHGPAEHVKRALDVAAAALIHGGDVPEAAIELMMKSPLPDAAYRLLGDLGWRYQAYQHGLAQRELRARPLG
jgi:hypothetical protein